MIDYNFEARATAEGYFAAGLALGLDNYKGPYFEPIVRHSGVKITLTYKALINGKERRKTETFVVIESDKLDINKKYYIND